MGLSISTEFSEPSGHFKHRPSEASITVYRDKASLHHKVEEQGLTADYAIAYSIGYGIVGRSYLIDLRGHLFQSPASFYTSKAEWDASPGYEKAHLLDFNRSINADCLSCHTGSIQQNSERVKLSPLSCERCHGPVEAHLNKPVPGSIVNPAKLAFRARDSVCEQCHLEGATTVLNLGKVWSDFRPGMALEQVETHYVFRNQDGSMSSLAAVSHAEQLAVSACRRNSGEKLWCGTCHDPHGPKVDRRAQMKQICESCHSTAQLAAIHSPGQDDCVACHMPRRSVSDIAHAAVTDHRILRRPATQTPMPAKQLLAVWHAPQPEIADRNLGLAYFHLARQNSSGADYRRAYDLLSKQPHAKDPEVAAAIGYMLLGTGNAKGAISEFETATNCRAENSEYWLDLGVAQQTMGDIHGAIQSFSRSTQLAPYDYRAYKALSDLYRRIQEPAQGQGVLQQFLSLVPQSLTVRLLPK
jgi:predicted CXXCH cytochrome family protein